MAGVETCLLTWCFIVSIFSYFACFWDKRKAVQHKWRVSERTLLLSAVLGGAPGLLLGMRTFRHKTKKWYFHAVGWLSLAAWIALWGWLLFL